MRVVLAVEQFLQKVCITIRYFPVQLLSMDHQVIGVAMPIAVSVLVFVVAIVQQSLQETPLAFAVAKHIRLLIRRLVCALE